MSEVKTATNNGIQFAWLLGATQGDFFHAKNLSNHLYQGSRSVRNPDVIAFLDELHERNLNDYWNSQKEFTHSFDEWLGLNLFNYAVDYSAGTTQSFDSFYFRHRTKRFRCYVGEYFYHLKTWMSNDVEWSFITDEEPLQKGDALVLSYPFCDTGNIYDPHEIFQTCDSLGIPVLMDCAYYPLTNCENVHFQADCIDTVTFSLSKIFPVANYRIGVRYTKQGIFDGQKLHDKINYNNHVSCHIGLKLINEYSPTYIADTYREKQKEVCDFFGIEASDSVIFGVAEKSWDWDKYSRRTLLMEYDLDFLPSFFVNRICLNQVYENWDLFRNMKNATTT